MWSSINALQLFDEVFFLTKGGPGTATYVPVLYLYKLAFEQGIAGYAAAIAYVLLIAILILTRDPALGRQTDGVLRVMSASAELRDEALLEPIEDVSTGDPERRRFLFSPWHLVLIPLAIVMLIPMIWMIITSLETLSETRHFPPILVPNSLQWQNYTASCNRRRSRGGS